MRLHLPHCVSCRRYYEKHLVLASLDPRAPSAERRLGQGLGLATAESAPRARAWALAAAAAAVAVVFSLGRPSSTPAVSAPPSGSFAARGDLGPPVPELFVYRLQPDEKLAPDATVHRGEDLAFAYANPSAYGRLLVFGVDEHKHVYWYYPAWSNAADDPRAVSIASGAPDLRELPEAIRHDLDGDRLVLYAEFSNDDVDVRAVEERVAAAPPGAPLALPGAYEQRTSLTLER
jgi:hypothetical protein